MTYYYYLTQAEYDEINDLWPGLLESFILKSPTFPNNGIRYSALAEVDDAEYEFLLTNGYLHIEGFGDSNQPAIIGGN